MKSQTTNLDVYGHKYVFGPTQNLFAIIVIGKLLKKKNEIINCATVNALLMNNVLYMLRSADYSYPANSLF